MTCVPRSSVLVLSIVALWAGAASLGLARADGGLPTAATTCQKALEAEGAWLVERELAALRGCTGAVFACIERSPNDAACLNTARALCARDLGFLVTEAGGPASEFAARTAPSCAGVPVATLTAAEGLGHGLRSCAAFDVPQIASTDDVLSCVARDHLCRATELLGAAVPRAAELLALGGIDVASVPCLGSGGADGRGRGLVTSTASSVRRGQRLARGARGRDARERRDTSDLRDVPGPEEAAATCQEAIAWAGEWFVRDYLKLLRPCLQASWACVAGTDDDACRADAEELCAVQIERIRGEQHSVAASFLQWTATSCGPRRLASTALLGERGLGFAALADECAALGVPALANADDVARCVLAAHDCTAQRIAAREVPRIEALLALGGVDLGGFDCLAAPTTSTCGDGEIEEGEACDPPGSFSGCAAGSWCSRSCACVPSRAPVIALAEDEYSVPEGAALVIPVTASDPDGDVVTLTAGPALPGATLTTTPGVAASATLSITPPAGTAGPFAVTFTARDPNGMTDTRTVVIRVTRVGHAPSVSVDPTATVAEGGLLTLAVATSDPDGDIVVVDVEPDPLPAHALFVPATGTLTFTPDFDQAGTYEFTFTADDGSASSPPVTCVVTVTDTVAGEPGETVGLTLEVDRAPSPTLLTTARITGRVNAIAGGTPPAAHATSALITGLGETQAAQGAALEVPLAGATCCGYETHFADGVSSGSFGEDVTVVALHVTGPAAATATILVDAAATPGPRQVTVQTGTETAVSAIAFRVVAGTARVRGTVIDAASRRAISGARVSVEGTAFVTTTAADGTFDLGSLPAGSRFLLVTAQDHVPTTFPVDAPSGATTDAGVLPLQPTVVDPSQPASVSLFSVLGRGIADLAGQPTVDAAKDVVRDTLLLVGGDEAGVLDAYGNQLNPRVAGDGLYSLRDAGVTLYASRMAAQDSTSLLEVLGQLSFGFAWSGAPPTVPQWLAALQHQVDAAWARPNDEASAFWIVLFNRDGARLSPNPPALTGETRLSRFQAYLAVTGFTGAFYRNQDGWATGSSTIGGAFTGPWARLVDGFAVKPVRPNWSSLAEEGRKEGTGTKERADGKDGAKDGAGDGSVLADFESLIRSYYLDQSEEALVRARELLLLTFPGIGLEQHFSDNPLGVKEALDKLITIATGDTAVRDNLVRITSRNADGSSSQQNLWSLFDIEQGPLNGFCFGAEFFGTFTMWPRIVQSSWAPNAPYIWSARETTRTLDVLKVPAVKVVFRPSYTEPNLYYRLWRIVHDAAAETFRDPGSDPRASMILVGFGKLDAGEPLAPKSETDGSGKCAFELLLPPFGMNHYRMDVVRYTNLGGDTTPEDLQKVGPWMAGYLDDPVSKPAFPGFGAQHLHMGTYYLHGDRLDVSPLSNAVAVNIGGQGSGLAQYGRIDLAVDPQDSSKIYVSIPGYKVDESENSRATGSILRFDSATSEANEFVRPGFMTPGQIGLAVDEFGNLFTDNAASDEAYGGRLFRFLGYRTAGEAPFDPAFPEDGSVPAKWFSGSVNYYSRMIQRANPASVQSMVMGPARRAGTGQELYVVDLMSNRIKSVAVHGAEQKNWDPWHVNGQDWAWTKPDTDPAPPARDQLAFGPMTDMAWAPSFDQLYLTCGSRVVRTGTGQNQSMSITQPAEDGGSAETIFQLPAGVAFCDAAGETILFVTDRAAGSIYRIPVADLPLRVPSDAAARKALADRYLFITGLEHPGQVRITDGGAAMVYTDATGVRYQKFGFTGRATDAGGTPLVGALVTLTSAAGTQTTTSDALGYYTFLERSTAPVVHATVQHGTTSYVERVTLTGRCNATLVSTPCVVITAPADGAVVTTGTVTVTGTILPRSANLTSSAVVLEVTSASGGVQSYPVVFTGSGNDFTVPGVALAEGDNALVVRTPALSGFAAGGSLVTSLRRDATPPVTQSAAGVFLDDTGNPRGRVTLDVLVDGVCVAQTETDSCGFWSAKRLPQGVVSVREAGE